MTIRTTSKTITFNRPFCLKGVDRLLPAGDYRVVTDEELIEGLSFPAYHRISTVIFVPAQSGSAVEMVTIEPWTFRRRRNKMGSEHCAIDGADERANHARLAAEQLQNYGWHPTEAIILR